MSGRLTVLLIVVLLAGCSTPLGADDPAGGDDQSSAGADTVTPVAVPDGDPGAAGIRVDGSRVVAPETLVAETDASLRGPHVRTETWSMHAGEERLLRYNRTVRDDATASTEVRAATGSATAVLLSERSSATTLSEHRFSSAYRGGAERTVDDETTGLSWIEAEGSFVEPLPHDDGDLLRALLSIPTDTTANASVVPGDGYRATGSTDDPPDALVAPWLTNAHDATVSARVSGDGAVTAVELSYRARYDGRSVRVSYRLEYRTP